ncbi:MAG: hypothetical protein H6740_00680 [Alphaproteobacteria bacterium]|nr:hypothetical protein [Alphaproteobacteria bacterium]
MRGLAPALLLLAACSEEAADPVPELPFPLGDPQVALFSVSPNNTPRRGQGFLLLSQGDMSCAELRALDLDRGVTPHLEGEDGLLFQMEYRRRGEDPDEGDPWGGLWMADQSIGDDTRRLSAAAVVDGFVTTLSGNRYISTGAWLDLERGDGRVLSRYHTPLWSGAAQAQDCGAWADADAGRDTDLDSEGWDTGRRDTGDVDTASDRYQGPTAFESVTYNCDSADWWYDVHTSGWSGGVRLFISQTGVAPEVRWYELGHPFSPTQSFDDAPNGDTRGYYDPRGYWDNPYLELGIVQDWQDAVIGETSLFQCTQGRIETLTWAIEVDDDTGSTLGCFAWGEDVTDQDRFDFQACQAI